MARTSKRPARSRRHAAGETATTPATNRDRIIEAFFRLLAEDSFERIGLTDVAHEAGLTLADLRDEFNSTLAILEAHTKEIDRQVLDSIDPDMEEESPRERLFDVLMRRLELLGNRKEAIGSLLRSAGSNPALALAFNGLAVRSQQWMLAAAGINASGPRGMLRAQGLTMLFANVLRTWVDDDDPGLARTLATLDRELARGQRMTGMLDGLCSISERACQVMSGLRRSRRRRGRDRDRDSDEALAL